MANSDPDSHEAGKKKKLDNTDGKSASTSPRSAIWNSSGKLEVILPPLFSSFLLSFLSFVYLVSN